MLDPPQLIVEGARSQSVAEREALLEGLQGGMKVIIPPLESLAMKTLPWNAMRQIRRYTTKAYTYSRVYFSIMHAAE